MVTSIPVPIDENNRRFRTRMAKIQAAVVEIVLLIVLKLCYVVLGHSEVGEKLQRVACHSEVVNRNFVVERL